MKRFVTGLVLMTTMSLGLIGIASAQDEGPSGPPPGGFGGPPPGGFGGPPPGGFGGGPGGRGGFGGPMMGGGLNLLKQATVQKELKMTTEQIAKVSTKEKELRQQMQSLFQSGGGPDSDPEDREKVFAKVQTAQKKAVADLLNADQQKRYHQLELQQQGVSALTRNTEVQTQLKLTDEQKEKMQAIQEEAMEAMRSNFQGQDFQSMTDEDRKALRTKMQSAQKETDVKILTVLTAEQKKQWQEMQGTPFTFPAMRFGRGGPGGGGGFGGPGGGGPPGPPPGE